jgi:hypothetical protein
MDIHVAQEEYTSGNLVATSKGGMRIRNLVIGDEFHIAELNLPCRVMVIACTHSGTNVADTSGSARCRSTSDEGPYAIIVTASVAIATPSANADQCPPADRRVACFVGNVGSPTHAPPPPLPHAPPPAGAPPALSLSLVSMESAGAENERAMDVNNDVCRWLASFIKRSLTPGAVRVRAKRTIGRGYELVSCGVVPCVRVANVGINTIMTWERWALLCALCAKASSQL